MFQGYLLGCCQVLAELRPLVVRVLAVPKYSAFDMYTRSMIRSTSMPGPSVQRRVSWFCILMRVLCLLHVRSLSSIVIHFVFPLFFFVFFSFCIYIYIYIYSVVLFVIRLEHYAPLYVLMFRLCANISRLTRHKVVWNAFGCLCAMLVVCDHRAS